MSSITGWGKGSVTGVTITRMNFHAFCPGPPSHPLENNEKMRMRNGDGPMNVFLLDGEQRPKDIFFFISASPRFSFDKSLAQILHHRFCIAVHQLLSRVLSFLQVASLAFRRNGDTSRILKAFALPPIIWASYSAIYQEHR